MFFRRHPGAQGVKLEPHPELRYCFLLLTLLLVSLMRTHPISQCLFFFLFFPFLDQSFRIRTPPSTEKSVPWRKTTLELDPKSDSSEATDLLVMCNVSVHPSIQRYLYYQYSICYLLVHYFGVLVSVSQTFAC